MLISLQKVKIDEMHKPRQPGKDMLEDNTF